jgi:hypothetical protein
MLPDDVKAASSQRGARVRLQLQNTLMKTGQQREK